MIPQVYVLDTETTAHFEAQEKPEVVELAYAPVTEGKLGTMFEGRFKPVSMPITLGALAVHHINATMLKDCVPSSEAKVPEDAAFIVGHNIDFDWKALGCPPVKRICTLAMARYLWDDGEAHTLGACIYRICEPNSARALLTGAHSAVVDVENSFKILQVLVKLAKEKGHSMSTWGEIWSFSENARLPRRWTFGKHKGKKIGQELSMNKADIGYHAWCDRQTDMDQYLKLALAAYKNGTLK